MPLETFEIHITGDYSIMQKAKPLKTIAVELLRPDGSTIRTEYMTSHVQHMASGLKGCLDYVTDIVRHLESVGVRIYRVKIESPLYSHYIEKSLYVESHFEVVKNPYDGFQHPTSRNAGKNVYLGTKREYDKDKYNKLIGLHDEIELCLHDTFVQQDKDWFDCYRVT